jgi:transporter family protein
MAILGAAFGGFRGPDGDYRQVGVENINSDFATLMRTVVILAITGGIVLATGQFQAPSSVSGRTYLFLVLSGLATGGDRGSATSTP